MWSASENDEEAATDKVDKKESKTTKNNKTKGKTKSDVKDVKSPIKKKNNKKQKEIIELSDDPIEDSDSIDNKPKEFEACSTPNGFGSIDLNP